MLGILRFFLASCVIVFHLSGQIAHIGLLAVNFFYVISGYLITLILNETYNFQFKEFSINRFLRLYPIYYFISAFALLLTVIPIDGVTSIGFHKNTTGTYQPMDLIANVLIFPFALINDASVISIPFINSFQFDDLRFRWLSTSWSVAVEIVCYFVLFVLTARRISFSLFTMAVSISFQIAVVHYNENILLNYSTFIAGLLPFALGSVGYFLSKKIESYFDISASSNKTQLLTVFFILALFIGNWYLASHEYGAALFTSIYFYLNTFIALLAVMSLHGMKADGLLGKVSKILGDISYPIFLCHFMVAYISWQLLGRPDYKTGWDIFLVSYPATLIFGYLTVKVIDEPVQKLRSIIRPK